MIRRINARQESEGKLLIAHGTMDTNVPPNNTLLVVNELIRANKDFDLIMFPNRVARLRQRAVYGAPPLGLLRATSSRGGASGQLRDAPRTAAADYADVESRR